MDQQRAGFVQFDKTHKFLLTVTLRWKMATQAWLKLTNTYGSWVIAILQMKGRLHNKNKKKLCFSVTSSQL